MRVSEGERARWEAAAAVEGRSLAEWVRRVCDAAADGAAVEPRRGAAALEKDGLTRESRPAAVVAKDASPAVVRVEGAALWSSRDVQISGRSSAGRRTEMCVHRRRPDEFCSRCDA